MHSPHSSAASAAQNSSHWTSQQKSSPPQMRPSHAGLSEQPAPSDSKQQGGGDAKHGPQFSTAVEAQSPSHWVSQQKPSSVQTISVHATFPGHPGSVDSPQQGGGSSHTPAPGLRIVPGGHPQSTGQLLVFSGSPQTASPHTGGGVHSPHSAAASAAQKESHWVSQHHASAPQMRSSQSGFSEQPTPSDSTQQGGGISHTPVPGLNTVPGGQPQSTGHVALSSESSQFPSPHSEVGVPHAQSS